MDRFIRRENIRRYRKLLREAKDDAERRLIKKLLTALATNCPPCLTPGTNAKSAGRAASLVVRRRAYSSFFGWICCCCCIVGCGRGF